MPLVSPWNWSSRDDQDLILSVQITFDNLIGTALTFTAHKDPGCRYTRFYFGLGGDGRPDSTLAQVTLADGDNIIGVAILNGFGFTTIQQALSVQSTAGP